MPAPLPCVPPVPAPVADLAVVAPLPAPLPEVATPEPLTPAELEEPPVVGASGRLGLAVTSKRPWISAAGMSRSERVDWTSMAFTTRRLRESVPPAGVAVEGELGAVLAASLGADGLAAAGGGVGGFGGWNVRPVAA